MVRGSAVQIVDKGEIRHIAHFLSEVYEGICEGDETTTMQAQLTELYRAVRRKKLRGENKMDYSNPSWSAVSSQFKL